MDEEEDLAKDMLEQVSYLRRVSFTNFEDRCIIFLIPSVLDVFCGSALLLWSETFFER